MGARKMRSVGAAIPFILFASAPVHAEERPVEAPLAAKVLPSRTLLFAAVENVTRTVDTLKATDIYKLWMEDEVQRFVAPVRPKIRDIVAKAEQMAELDFGDFAAAFGGQVALAFVGIEFPADAEPLPKIALVAEITDRAAALRLLERLKRAVAEAGKAELTTSDVGPLSFGRIAPEGSSLELGYVMTRNAIYVALGPEGRLLHEMLASALVGTAGTLAEDEDFLAAVERAGERRDIFGYLSWRRGMDLAFIIAEHQKATPGEVEQGKLVLAALGLDTVRSVSFVEAVDPPGFRSQLFVHAPAPRRGLFGLISEEPVRESMINIAPPEARSFGTIRLRPDRLLPLLREVAGIAAPGGVAQMDAGLEMLKQAIGIDVEKGVIKGRGLEGTVLMVPTSAPALGPTAGLAGLSVVLRVARPDEFKPVFAVAMMLVRVAAAGQQATVTDSVTRDGATITSFTFPGAAPLGIVPSVALIERQPECYLVVSLSVEAATAVARSLVAPPPESVADGAEYLRTLARAGVEPGFLVTFARPARVEDVRPALAMIPLVGPMAIRQALTDRSVPPDFKNVLRSIDFARLPSAETLTKHGVPQMVVGSTDEDGVCLTTYGPVGLSALGAAGGVVAAGVALPAIMQARDAARRARCTSNLRQIVTALKMYDGDNGGKFPARLENLLPDYLADESALRCPSSGKPYAYVSGLRGSDPSHLVVVYEPAGNHMRGANAAYLNGTARWRPNAQWLKRQVDMQMRMLRARGRQIRIIGPGGAPAEPEPPEEPEEFF